MLTAKPDPLLEPASMNYISRDPDPLHSREKTLILHVLFCPPTKGGNLFVFPSYVNGWRRSQSTGSEP